MNPVALLRNFVRCYRLAPGWKNRLNYLTWLYASSLSDPQWQRSWTITLCLPGMNCIANFYLRANRGSDRHTLGEIFEGNCYAVNLNCPRRILDLGANSGLASLYFGLKWPGVEIIAVEPMPGNAAAARRNFELNMLRGKVIESAIDTDDGSLNMRRGQGDTTNRVECGPSGKADSLQVHSRSVTSILDEAGWTHVDLVKMDIEGYEEIVLQKNNDWLRLVTAVCLEVHGAFGETELQQLARQFGFQLSQLPAGTWFLRRCK